MFFTAFDSKYFEWGVLLFRQLERFHPNTTVAVVGVDLSNRQIDELRRIKSRTRIIETSVPETGNNRSSVVANKRPYWLWEATAKLSPDWLILLDADLLIRRSLDDLLVAHGECDAAVVMRSGLHNARVWQRLRVAAGFILFRRSGYGLIWDWCQTMKTSAQIEDVRPFEWFWEQTCLYEACFTGKWRIGHIDAGTYLSSWPFNSSASVWSANVKEPMKSKLLKLFQSEAQ
jgi:hypothetical protein